MTACFQSAFSRKHVCPKHLLLSLSSSGGEGTVGKGLGIISYKEEWMTALQMLAWKRKNYKEVLSKNYLKRACHHKQLFK